MKTPLYETIAKYCHWLKTVNDNYRDQVESAIDKLNTVLPHGSGIDSCEPVFMVVMLSNACCYGRVEPSNELMDAACAWAELDGSENTEDTVETILSNSFIL